MGADYLIVKSLISFAATGQPMVLGQLERRDFIRLLGSAAAAWPLAARAQPADRVRRIGVLLGTTQTGPEPVPAFVQELRRLGWTEGRDVRIEYRAIAGDIKRFRTYATELVGLVPDVILVQSNPGLAALQQETRTIPIVFVQVADPVGSGFIESLARPGGNTTGFTNFESSMGSKWLELLKEASPRTARVHVLLHPETAANMTFWRAAEAVASSLGVELKMAGVHDAAEIEQALSTFSREQHGGLIAMPHTVTVVNHQLIIELARRHRLPALFAFRYSAVAGALMSYGVDADDLYRRAAAYVDRILKGAKPADLPVQAPVKFELAVNLKTAKALGLTIPESFLLRADEVIE
jgi:putative ABC transport system substrate-binding protein